MGMKENFWQRLIGGCWVFICFRASRGIFCLWVSTLCRAEWNQGDIEESRVWLFSDRFDDNQDLGSEGRPAGCWETPCPRNFKFAHLELFHVLNLISLERKREKFLRLSFHCFSRDSLNLRGLFPQWISLLGDREMKEIRGERDRETERHVGALIALWSLDFSLSCLCEVLLFIESEDSSCLLWLTDRAQHSSGRGYPGLILEP